MGFNKYGMSVMAAAVWSLALVHPVLAQSATGPASQPAQALMRPLVIGPDLNGENVPVFVGQQIVLNLPANPSTGYQWTMTSFDGDCLRQTGGLGYVPFKTTPPNMVGASGQTVATFDPVKVGQTTLRLHYSRAAQPDDPLAKNYTVTITVHADPTERRTVILKNNLGNFSLALSFVGDTDKPFYRLFLTTRPIPPVKQPDPFLLQAEITREQASKLVDVLADAGFLRRASDSKNTKMLDVYLPGRNAYTLTVGGGMSEAPVQYFHGLGFDLATLHYLDGLEKVLQEVHAEQAAKDQAQLISRLEGFRKQWLAEGQAAPGSQPATTP